MYCHAFHARECSKSGPACQYFLYSRVKRPGGRAAIAACAPRCGPSRVAFQGKCSQISKGERIPLAAKRDPYTPEQPTTRSLFRYPQSGDTPQLPGKVATLPKRARTCHSALALSLRTPKRKFVQTPIAPRGVHKIFFQRAVRSPAHSPLGRSMLVPEPRTLWGSRSVSPSHLRKAKKQCFFRPSEKTYSDELRCEPSKIFSPSAEKNCRAHGCSTQTNKQGRTI